MQRKHVASKQGSFHHFLASYLFSKRQIISNKKCFKFVLEREEREKRGQVCRLRHEKEKYKTNCNRTVEGGGRDKRDIKKKSQR